MKRIGKIKRISVLCLIFLLSINSFATSISNNDGSAFITKAEFDALKSSFQAQIDKYNTGIDSKIDEAISAYLAGRGIKMHFTRALLCANETGVIESAVGNATFPWILGDPTIAMQSVAQTTQSGVYATFFRFEGRRDGGTPFYERIITDVDYTIGTGKWYGYCETNQIFTLYGIYEDWNTDSTASANKPEISYVEGWHAYSNKNFNSGETGELIRFGMSPSYSWPWWIEFTADTASSGFERQYIGNPKSKYLNCFDSNLGAYRFSNYNIRDFANDVFLSDHGPEVKHIDEIFPDFREVTYYGAKAKSTDYGWFSGSKVGYAINNWQSNHLNCAYWPYQTCFNLPYIGFVNDIRDWGRIWTDKYDSIMDDVLKKNPSVSHVSVSKASGNVNHLNLDAGTPMFQIEGSGIYSVDIEFDDAGDHGVWFKKNGWARQARPCDQTDNLKCKNASDFTILNGDGYEVPNGEKKTFEFEFTNADIGSFVFMSWSTISGPVTDWHGGGTLKIPENYAVNIVK